MMTVGTSNEPQKKINQLVISNPHKDDLSTFYTLMLWMFKEHQNRDKVLETKIELGDVLSIDSNEIDKIVSETNLTKYDIQKMLKHLNNDVRNILNATNIAGM